MSSAGTVLDMINRAKYNRSLNKPRRSRHARMRKAYEGQLSERKIDINKNHLPEAEFKILQQKIKWKIRRNRVKTNILTSTVTAIVIAAIFFSVIYFNEIMQVIKDSGLFSY